MTSNIEYINKIQGALCYDETQYKQALRVSCENTNRISVELSRPLHQFYEVIVLESTVYPSPIIFSSLFIQTGFEALLGVFRQQHYNDDSLFTKSFLLLVYNDSFKVVYDLKKNELRVVIT